MNYVIWQLQGCRSSSFSWHMSRLSFINLCQNELSALLTFQLRAACRWIYLHVLVDLHVTDWCWGHLMCELLKTVFKATPDLRSLNLNLNVTLWCPDKRLCVMSATAACFCLNTLWMDVPQNVQLQKKQDNKHYMSGPESFKVIHLY